MRKPVKHIQPAEFVKTYYKQGRNATRAIKELDSELTQYSAENKGSRMLNNAKVQHLMQIVEDKLKENAIKGVKRLEKLIDDEDSRVALQASTYSIDHAIGKAVQRTVVHTTKVSVSLNLVDNLVDNAPEQALNAS